MSVLVASGVPTGPVPVTSDGDTLPVTSGGDIPEATSSGSN